MSSGIADKAGRTGGKAGLEPFLAVETDGVLLPYGGGPLPGYEQHAVASAVWQGRAAFVFPRPVTLWSPTV